MRDGERVERGFVLELHYITPIANLASIATEGIMSHRLADAVDHESVADGNVQDLRRDKHVPGGRALHDYANLYFDARNPMMYKRLNRRNELAVVRVHPDVLDLPGTVITDGNAASNATRFYPSPTGLTGLDRDKVYAEYWTDVDPWVMWEKKRQRCAEVLVLDRVPCRFLLGCHVCTESASYLCRQAAPHLDVAVNKVVYFG